MFENPRLTKKLSVWIPAEVSPTWIPAFAGMTLRDGNDNEPMIDDAQLKKILLELDMVTEDQFNQAQKQAQAKGITVAESIVDLGLMADKHLGKVLADELKMPFIDLSQQKIPEELLKIIPERAAQNQKVVVFDQKENILHVATSDPENLKIQEEIKKATNKDVEIYYATPLGIAEALHAYKKGLAHEFKEIIQGHIDEARGKTKPEEPSIIKLVNVLLEYAYENRASDIHIQPQKNSVPIRFRIDGILHEVVELPKNLLELVVSRIKVMAKLRTDEHMAAQDGKFRSRFVNEEFDVRVSIVPITEGEKIVMRLLSEKSRSFELENLGFSDHDLKKLKEAMARPYGMILSCGPTGSGKTTTLYGILKILNTPDVNIATIEDPVEYAIDGVNQIQVNPKTNLTFTQGLRAIVRQDPDIIMVGEVRDDETANIAVNSAMTGHLVLSTMHSNNAATCLPRLQDMNVQNYLVASAVNIIIGQRLVRRICFNCRQSYNTTKQDLVAKLPPHLIKLLFKDKKEITLYKGLGCRSCAQTGYLGRIGIFEILALTDEIKALIMGQADADQIQKQAQKQGMTLMIEDGIDKVFNGLTTIEEIIRVTR